MVVGAKSKICVTKKLNNMKMFIHKLNACWRIFKFPHSAVISLDSKNITEMFKENDFETEIYFVGLREYPFYKMVNKISESKSFAEMIESEMKFKSNAEATKIKQ